MSKKYRQAHNQELVPFWGGVRSFVARPGRRDVKGKLCYVTEQSHRDLCDINNIIKKYDRTGLITHVQRMEASYGDLSGVDYKTMMDKVAGANSMFQRLPAKIRARFKNDPTEYLAFCDDPKNRDEAIKLKLIPADSAPEKDGIGEHVKDDGGS